MIEKLKKYLTDYSKEIDEQPQEYDKSLRDLWQKNAELALSALADLNVRYPDLSSRRIKIYYDDIVASDKKTFEALEKKIHLIYDYTELAAKYEQSVIDRPVSEMVADQGFLLDDLRSILSEDYRPPEEIEDAINHLSTLYLLYSHLMPTTPGLSNAVPLRAGYALALLNGNALIKSLVGDEKGFESAKRSAQKEADDKKEADMKGLISQVCEGLNINEYRNPDGKIKYYSMATEIQECFKKDEGLKKQLGKISKKYKNGTKIPDKETIVKYLRKIDLENPKR